jgi:hypothetical protein
MIDFPNLYKHLDYSELLVSFIRFICTIFVTSAILCPAWYCIKMINMYSIM